MPALLLSRLKARSGDGCGCRYMKITRRLDTPTGGEFAQERPGQGRRAPSKHGGGHGTRTAASRGGVLGREGRGVPLVGAEANGVERRACHLGGNCYFRPTDFAAKIGQESEPLAPV